MSDWFYLLEPPYIYLILGLSCLIGGVVATCTGRVYGQFGVSASRAEKPAQFWLGVAFYCLSGILCIGIFLHQVFAVSKCVSP